MCFLFPNETAPSAPFNLLLAKRVHGPIKTQLVASVSRRCDMNDEHNKRKSSPSAAQATPPGIEPTHCSPPRCTLLILQPSPQRWSSEERRKTPPQQYRCVYKKSTLKATSMNVLNIPVREGLSFGLHWQQVELHRGKKLVHGEGWKMSGNMSVDLITVVLAGHELWWPQMNYEEWLMLQRRRCPISSHRH